MRPRALTGAATPELPFAAAMARAEPFETAPLLAAAVSGGPDSIALALLAQDWAQARGGRLVALTVDHRLRPESAEEAARVARWMEGRGIEHRTLVVRQALSGNLQAAAREARYALLEGWCREASCLHLLAGHQADDQAETLLLRLSRGSGLDGLAGMPLVTELAHCRLLRPLLGMRRQTLAAFLAGRGQEFLTDPGNLTPRFARNRVRAALDAEGLSPARLLSTARNLGRARAALEQAVDALLAGSVLLDPAGFALVEKELLAAAPDEVRLRVLARLVTTIGGGAHPPRLERLERAAASLGAARTLAGCRLLPWRGKLLVCREASACEQPVPLAPGEAARWDGRFEARLRADAPAGLRLGAAGSGIPGELPGAVKESLPALRDLEGILAVPHLHYCRMGIEPPLEALTWRPRRGLTRAGFTVA